MKMLEKAGTSITEDEAALYDRQIRLWGLDAQKRLRASRVLVAGVCGLGAEVTKNLVLSGVKSLTLLDHRDVTELDTYANFFAPHDSIGENIAVASQERAQNLNPMVEVTAETEKIDHKTDGYFTQFEIICVTRTSRQQLLRINAVCRQNNILFYSGDVFGLFGYMFVDLQDHKYVDETKEKVQVEDETGKIQMVEETKMVKKTESFVPLGQALEVDWRSNKYASRLRRTSPSYFIMHVLMEFVTLHGRTPDPAQREVDEIELLTIKNALFEKMSIPQEKVSNQFAELVFGQVSPVCAIVGGVMAQEMIKAVSQKDAPHNNFFFFNTMDGAGVVENIGL